jgi:LysR family hydrogen peroxide-inducible transcriptional activator
MVVTLRQMQYICAVAETQSFSKAAELCFADQSTVSQQIKQFEEKLKCKSILTGVEELIKPIKKDIHRFQ